MSYIRNAVLLISCLVLMGTVSSTAGAAERDSVYVTGAQTTNGKFAVATFITSAKSKCVKHRKVTFLRKLKGKTKEIGTDRSSKTGFATILTKGINPRVRTTFIVKVKKKDGCKALRGSTYIGG